ncbi:hypothetical protein EZ449_16285 [Pedobacter frigidisoli]|uniref:Peptidase M60 domain-containing protein n=1 Tax=Pedobacter frigidisoli TaxID=2530455 RepID=A0A4R0P282_9SPHI|nr:M60 family metallopeptidase [Pedobacter frigidisoli]TCD05645.1 hypothetical protein EZ449_16285 [Pedobacter frigidisoli]
MKKLLLLAAILAFGIRSFSQTSDPVSIIISPQKPLSAKDVEFRKAISKWSDKQLTSSDVKGVKPHPSSAIFPGAVKPGFKFVNKTVHINHQKIKDTDIGIVSRMQYSSPWNNNLYSTGLYAIAGEFIEIDIPKGINTKDLKVQIGAHSDRLDQWVAGKEDWRRMPIVTKTQALKNGKNIVASPFGGLVYISISPKAENWESNILIKHAISAPIFILGKTTKAEWAVQLQSNNAPWGELASENIILTLPDSVLKKVSDPDEVMKLWDLIIGGEMELAQINKPYYRAQRIVIDEHIGGGFMHSGYPIMVHHSPTRRMLSADVVANPMLLMTPSKGGANWGFFHEIGHNMQNLDWVFGGTTEVSCNFFSLYMFDRLLGGRDDAHGAISNANTQKSMKKYFLDGPDYEKWKNDPFLGLIMFRQLQEGFGWESFKAFFREYQKLANEKRMKDDDQQKRDLWAKTYSIVVQRNVAPFFEKWGIPISDTTKVALKKFATWMPYNFPPIN